MGSAASKSRATGTGGALVRLVLETLRLGGRLTTATDRLSESLSTARWQVLEEVEEGGLPTAQIARNLGLARQSVQRTVDVLAAEGKVTFAPNPNHRRAKLVEITAAGRRSLGEFRRAQGRWTRRIGRDLSAAELERATEILRHLRAKLDREER